MEKINPLGQAPGLHAARGTQDCSFYHETKLGYGSSPFEPDAEPVKPEAEYPAKPEDEPTPVIKKTQKKQKAAKEKSALSSVKVKEPDEAPVAADEWPLCGSEDREINRDCEFRAKHVLDGCWKECETCRPFVDQIHQELAQ